MEDLNTDSVESEGLKSIIAKTIDLDNELSQGRGS